MSAPWHTRAATEVTRTLRVDPTAGLSTSEVAQRASEHGPNALDQAAPVPLWRKILRLLTDQMTLVLLAAAIVSAVVSREWETPVVILVVIAFNTLLNYVQEARAENSLAALRTMSVSTSRVRRNGADTQVDRVELVPGDIVLLEAGDAVPADGRVIESAQLQVAESVLTGESQPVDKSPAPVEDPEVPLGDRAGMVFMNTSVTRGRGVMVVTGTGMNTEMGAIAGLLGSSDEARTPLQQRIDRLARLLTVIALVVVLIVVGLGLLRGQPWSELLLTAVSLAVATIPEGLPAVVAFTLAMGSNRLAKRGAVIKQLAAVETLGSTTHIVTDKTGTLTLNEMTVRRLHTGAGQRFRVTGEGYSTDGRILSPDGNPAAPTRTRTWPWPCATTPPSTTGTSSEIPPTARWWCWPRRAGSTWRAPGATTRGWRRCRSTPTTSSRPPSTNRTSGSATRQRPTTGSSPRAPPSSCWTGRTPFWPRTGPGP